MEEAANNPLVSVVIPCYNSQAYVGEAIRSALDQTHKNLEVIVIDDGSSDASLQVIKSFGQSVRWETGPNRGAPAARNRGAELARGEFIQFLDADDLLLPEKVETCLHAGSSAGWPWAGSGRVRSPGGMKRTPSPILPTPPAFKPPALSTGLKHSGNWEASGRTSCAARNPRCTSAWP